jgi:hypothetical protein
MSFSFCTNLKPQATHSFRRIRARAETSQLYNEPQIYQNAKTEIGIPTSINQPCHFAAKIETRKNAPKRRLGRSIPSQPPTQSHLGMRPGLIPSNRWNREGRSILTLYLTQGESEKTKPLRPSVISPSSPRVAHFEPGWLCHKRCCHKSACKVSRQKPLGLRPPIQESVPPAKRRPCSPAC